MDVWTDGCLGGWLVGWIDGSSVSYLLHHSSLTADATIYRRNILSYFGKDKFITIQKFTFRKVIYDR